MPPLHLKCLLCILQLSYSQRQILNLILHGHVPFKDQWCANWLPGISDFYFELHTLLVYKIDRDVIFSDGIA